MKLKNASICVLFILASCNKFITIDAPVNNADASIVYSTDGTAISVLTGLYTTMSASSSAINGINGMSLIAGLSGDELQAYSSVSGTIQLQAYANELSNIEVPFWTQFYRDIYVINAVLKGVNESSKLSVNVKKQLIGEARFLRAFYYFYLVNFFGDVPFNNTTDYRITSIEKRMPQKEVYQQIISDLKEAQELLSSDYLALDLNSKTEERVRPTKWVATALLARTYLFTKDFANAEIEADKVINNTELYSLESDLNNIFLKNGHEDIWQLQGVEVGLNTADGNAFVLSAIPSFNTPVSLTKQLYNAFEMGDKRKLNWIGTFLSGQDTFYYPNKYKIGLYNVSQPIVEYETIFRLAEQYLIRAEARIRQRNYEGARSDINVIRHRAGLNNITVSEESVLITAIEQEYRIELFSEFGHRWLDLKRWPSFFSPGDDALNRADDVLKPIKKSWNKDDKLYPIPLDEIKKNKNLTQNNGY
jgi:hypothetical protein